MKRFLKGFAVRMLLLNILVLYSITGFSAKYYVDVAGSNSNSGSSSSPWLTLAHACAIVTTPGDIIHLNAGTFNETSRANLAVGVSIEGAGMDATIINSRYVASNSSDGVIRLNSSSYTNGNQSISNLTLTGSKLTATRGICINYRNNVMINNCKVTDFYASAIFFRGSNKAWDVEPSPYCSGNKIYNCIVNNSATRSSGESASIRINGQKDFLLYNNTFDQTFRSSGQNGNILGGEWNQALKIYDNTFTKNDNEGGAWNFFFELWHWQGGGEIYRNTFNGAATMDIVDVMKSTYEFGLKIYDNKYLVKEVVPFTAHQVQAINLEGRSHLDDIHVYSNYMKNVTNGIWVDVIVNTGEGYSSFAVNNLYIHHNVMENIGMTDVNTIPIWMNAYGSNTNISFNNIQVNNNTIQCSNIIKGLNAIKWSVIGKFSNIFIQNNIFTNCKDNVLNFSPQVSGATLSNVTIKNNLYYNNGVNSSRFDMAVTNKVESGNIIGNPLFISSTNLNLQAGSSAINTGINVGFAYNGSAPDLGAYESNTGGNLSVNDDDLVQNTYFVGNTSENASATMNIEIKGIHEAIFSKGDELAVFDGNTCVSSIVLSDDNLTDGIVSITAPIDEVNQTGFTDGHPIQIWAWDAQQGVESQIPTEVITGKMIFEAQSSVVVQVKNITTDITDVLNTMKLEVYPNPFVDGVTIRFSEVPAIGSRIDIWDNTGKRIESRVINNSQETFDLKDRPAGIYVVKTIAGRNEIIKKIIKN